MSSVASLVAEFNARGFVRLSHLASPETLADLRQAVEALSPPASKAGVRHLLRHCPVVARWSRSPELIARLRPFANAAPFVVRGILFDKTPESNWLVPWHQDLTIAVRERCDTPGYGPWSIKDGTPHVQPPIELLERLLTVRLNLDDCAADNGALRVLPGSHQQGRLSAESIQALRREKTEEVFAARAGEALLMRPLLLHASSAAAAPRHRRIVHLEFASEPLPNGLHWLDQENT